MKIDDFRESVLSLNLLYRETENVLKRISKANDTYSKLGIEIFFLRKKRN